MASTTCIPSDSKWELPVAIHRKKSELPNVLGTVTWISNSEFKLIVDRPLQFQEKLQVVMQLDSCHEVSVIGYVDNLKQQSGEKWLVHGSFEELLNDVQWETLVHYGNWERRKEARRDCELLISMKSNRGSERCQIAVTNISSIGCCFQSKKDVLLNERIELLFEKAEQQVLCVPAVVCRSEPQEGIFVVGCSFMTNLELLACESTQQSSFDWRLEMNKLLEKLPSI